MTEKPTLWVDGITKRDRLLLWHVAYKVPPPLQVTPDVLQSACQACRYPLERALLIIAEHPQVWARAMQKRAARLSGEPDPTGDTTPRRIGSARLVNLRCNHPRMARKMRKAGVLA